MIHSITINNLQDSKFEYLSKVSFFKKNKTIEFKPGINLLIGENGCGKSSLMKMIKFQFMELESEVPELREYAQSNFFKDVFSLDARISLYNGIQVKADYSVGTYSFTPDPPRTREKSIDEIVREIDLDSNHKSKGEIALSRYCNWLGRTYSDLERTSNRIYKEPLKVLKRFLYNEPYVDAIEDAQKYYRNNSVKDSIPAFLLDEPEANLDIVTCIRFAKTFDTVLNFSECPRIQYIMVIHDPYIIRYLSKIKNVNIIEMSEDYLKAIDSYFKV